MWVRPLPALLYSLTARENLETGAFGTPKESVPLFLNQIETHRTLTNPLVDDYLLTWMEAFLIDRKARGIAEVSLRFYRIKPKWFTEFCETQVVTQISQITLTMLSRFLSYIKETNRVVDTDRRIISENMQLQPLQSMPEKVCRTTETVSEYPARALNDAPL